MFAQNELVRAAIDLPSEEYVPFDWVITYAINIPFSLFALELLGRGWRTSLAI